MPKLKQVVSLETMAQDVFIESIAQCCNRLSDIYCLEVFRQCVTVMGYEVLSRLPGKLLTNFANRFFEIFYSEKLTGLHYIAAFEIIMNTDIDGLRLKGRNLRYLRTLENRCRFQKLEELDLRSVISRMEEPLCTFIQEYQLKDLTTFIYPKFCTDSDLKIIGQQCPKLKVIKVFDSEYVTDDGLRFLSPCSCLQDVQFRRCSGLSHRGSNYMLSVHPNLKVFCYVRDWDHRGLYRHVIDRTDAPSGLDLSVQVPSLESLIIETSCMNNRPALNLERIVKKFPNLTNLKINCKAIINQYMLKNLKKLTALKINITGGMSSRKLGIMWMQIEEILRRIGSNITTLKLYAHHLEFVCKQEHLNLIYNCCPNLECLGFDHKDGILIVPKFERLKVLSPHAEPYIHEMNYSLKLTDMSSLETLKLPHGNINSQSIRSIVSDKFPNLSMLRTTGRLDSIKRKVECIAKDRNLDIQVKRIFSPLYSTFNDVSSDDESDDLSDESDDLSDDSPKGFDYDSDFVNELYKYICIVD